MWRFLGAIGIVVLVSSATIGYATGVTVGAASLSAGSAPVGTCDSDGVSVDYEFDWAGYVALEHVRISGIDDACVGLRLTVVLLIDGTSVPAGTYPVSATDADDNVVSVPVPGGIKALDLDTIHLVIT